MHAEVARWKAKAEEAQCVPFQRMSTISHAICMVKFRLLHTSASSWHVQSESSAACSALAEAAVHGNQLSAEVKAKELAKKARRLPAVKHD
jgi:hypothetical protein